MYTRRLVGRTLSARASAQARNAWRAVRRSSSQRAIASSPSVEPRAAEAIVLAEELLGLGVPLSRRACRLREGAASEFLGALQQKPPNPAAAGSRPAP